MKRFITALLIGALVFAFGSWAAFTFLYPLAEMIVPSYLLIAIFCVFTFGSGYVLFQAGMKRPEAFVRTYMGSMAFKLFLYLGTLIAFILIYKEFSVEVVIVFFALYVVMTVLEKLFVVNAVKDNLNQPKESSKPS